MKDLKIELFDNIKVTESFKAHGKDSKGKTLGKRIEKTKVSNKTKRLAQESLAIDNIKGTKYHCVKELSENNEFKVVHEHLEFQKKKSK
jgi:hypothetical protein